MPHPNTRRTHRGRTAAVAVGAVRALNSVATGGTFATRTEAGSTIYADTLPLSLWAGGGSGMYTRMNRATDFDGLCTFAMAYGKSWVTTGCS